MYKLIKLIVYYLCLVNHHISEELISSLLYDMVQNFFHIVGNKIKNPILIAHSSYQIIFLKNMYIMLNCFYKLIVILLKSY